MEKQFLRISDDTVIGLHGNIVNAFRDNEKVYLDYVGGTKKSTYDQTITGITAIALWTWITDPIRCDRTNYEAMKTDD